MLERRQAHACFNIFHLSSSVFGRRNRDSEDKTFIQSVFDTVSDDQADYGARIADDRRARDECGYVFGSPEYASRGNTHGGVGDERTYIVNRVVRLVAEDPYLV